MHDKNSTIKSIIQAAKFPLSIIIVGVGNDDFKAMEVYYKD